MGDEECGLRKVWAAVMEEEKMALAIKTGSIYTSILEATALTGRYLSVSYNIQSRILRWK
jgi:hypothetical protein